jgi:hypothetical protein
MDLGGWGGFGAPFSARLTMAVVVNARRPEEAMRARRMGMADMVEEQRKL